MLNVQEHGMVTVVGMILPWETTVHNKCPPFISSSFVDYSSKFASTLAMRYTS